MAGDLSSELQRLLSVSDLTVLSSKRDMYLTLRRFGFEDWFKLRCSELSQTEPYHGNLGLRFERALKELLGLEGDVGLSYPSKVLKSDTDEALLIAGLLDAAVGRDAPIDEEVRWVTRNIPRKWGEIKASDVPSEWAVSTLAFAKRNEGEFRKSYDARVLAARVDRQSSGKGFQDDGRTLDILSRQLKELVGDEVG
jgi:hypothetical protein